MQCAASSCTSQPLPEYDICADAVFLATFVGDVIVIRQIQELMLSLLLQWCRIHVWAASCKKTTDGSLRSNGDCTQHPQLLRLRVGV
jgi:hypothetical protein